MEEMEKKKSNSLPHTDGHSASVNTISSSSVVMTKNQMNFEQSVFHIVNERKIEKSNSLPHTDG